MPPPTEGGGKTIWSRKSRGADHPAARRGEKPHRSFFALGNWLFVLVLRVAFLVTILSVFCWTAVLGQLIHLLPFVPKARKETLSMLCLHASLSAAFAVMPWIRVEYADGFHETVAKLRKDKALKKSGVLFMNHTSMLDSLFMGYVLPKDLVASTRTLAKSALFKPPILGTVFRVVGMFQVFFKNDTDFRVDKEKQLKETKRIETHLRTGGTLTFCPEGTINRGDATKIQPLRRGSFRLAAEHTLPISIMICTGLEKVWPPSAFLGGFPATVRVGLDYVKSKESWGTVVVDDDTNIAKLQQAACDTTHARMQALLDAVTSSNQDDDDDKKTNDNTNNTTTTTKVD
mmetsp:Transcript_24170/g.77961  ORF Transcript_24170/g.77961 Transcript_24170/m.77961 type:complete len:345 (-) Transcript_24170:104-1138(-)